MSCPGRTPRSLAGPCAPNRAAGGAGDSEQFCHPRGLVKRDGRKLRPVHDIAHGRRRGLPGAVRGCGCRDSRDRPSRPRHWSPRCRPAGWRGAPGTPRAFCGDMRASCRAARFGIALPQQRIHPAILVTLLNICAEIGRERSLGGRAHLAAAPCIAAPSAVPRRDPDPSMPGRNAPWHNW